MLNRKRKVWDRQDTFKLIKEYHVRPILWNSKVDEYRNKEKKYKTYNELAEIFQTTIEEIQRKLHNLRNQVSQEIQKIKKKENYVSNWPFFNVLQFIVPITSLRSSQLILPATTEDNSEEGINYTERQLATKNIKHVTNTSVGDSYQPAHLTEKEPDDFERFGQYIAMEIRNIKCEFNRRKLISEIRKAIVRIADEDLYGAPASNSNSHTTTTEIILNPSLSNTFLKLENEPKMN